MQKDFDAWNIQKKAINNSNKVHFFHEREVWWCSIGANIGFEEDGKGKAFFRPVLILKKYNRNHLLIVPLSSRIKKHPLRYTFMLQGKQQNALLSQLRVIDSKRLQRRMGRVSVGVFKKIQELVRERSI